MLDNLKKSLRDSSPEDVAPIVSTLSSEPTREYETYRRRAYRDVQELWFYARAKLESLKKEGGGIEAKVKDALGELESREQVVLLDLEMMKKSDGHDDWRETEARELSQLVQVRKTSSDH